MKQLSKILIIAGTGLLFLICVLIGVLYYRNLNRNETAMAVTIERNLKEYLNEKVSELNPQFLEKEEDAEQINKLSEQLSKELTDQVLKELSKQLSGQISKQVSSEVEKIVTDRISQYFSKEKEKFLTKKEIEKLSAELLSSLKEQLLQEITKENNIEKDKLLALIEQLKGSNEQQIKDLKTALEELKKQNNNAALEEWKKQNNTVLEGMKTAIASMESSMKAINDRMQKLSGDVNVKVERWDADTQTLYLIPVK